MTTPTILLAEEAPNVRQVLAFILEEHGYRVLQSWDGRDTLAQAREHVPDLLVMESMLPYRTGFEICAVLKRDQRLCRIPILMTSALTRGLGQGDEYWRARCSADDFLSKPFDMTELLWRIERLLEASRRRRPDVRDEAGIPR